MRSIFSTLFLMICFSAFSLQRDGDYGAESHIAYKKLYIDPEKIVIHNGQMFLYSDDNVMRLGSLFSDEQGLHLKAAIIDSWWTCICGWEYPDHVTKCQNPRCVLSK